MIYLDDDESPGCIGTALAIVAGIAITIILIKTLQWMCS